MTGNTGRLKCGLQRMGASLKGMRPYFSAAATGLKPEKKITVFFGDYADEREAEVCGRVLDIYRTHFRDADERMELYMSEKAGS